MIRGLEICTKICTTNKFAPQFAPQKEGKNSKKKTNIIFENNTTS